MGIGILLGEIVLIQVIKILENGELQKELLELLKKRCITPEQAYALFQYISVNKISTWNYTEKESKNYTLKELMKWIQDNLDKNIHSAASVTKEMQDGKIILRCCFLDKNKEPLAKIGDLFLKVRTDSICDDLKNNFGDKDMIVIE